MTKRQDVLSLLCLFQLLSEASNPHQKQVY